MTLHGDLEVISMLQTAKEQH